jgi:mycothiol synthase
MVPVDEVPPGFEVRSVSGEDAPTVVDLINECMLAEIGTPWTTVEETRDDLTSPGRGGGRDDALLFDTGGTAVGYLQFWADAEPFTDLEMLGYVRPRLWGRGLNTFLLRLGEERARAKVPRAPVGERVVLQVARFADNEPAGRLFTSLGYRHVRTFWMMRKELESPSPAPRLPDGISIRTFERERDEVALHAALSEAFGDHWGTPFPPLEQWLHMDLKGDGAGFDPSLWFLAIEGDEIVGAACCRAGTTRDPAAAQVNDLAVRREWRGRGVGIALLQTAFGELRRRAIPRVELGVDSENATGATRLYERAGMHVAYAWEFWQKELRAASSVP